VLLSALHTTIQTRWPHRAVDPDTVGLSEVKLGSD
jgi:hypothetical protein